MNLLKPRRAPTASSEATRWFALMQSHTVSADERRRFAEWLAADPAHRAAYQELQRFWHALDTLDTCDVQDLAAGVGAAPEQRVRSRWRTWVAPFATAAVLVLLTVWWLGDVQVRWADYRTAAGEQHTVTLPDGSIAHLNTETALSVDMDGPARQVTIHRGEAFFTATSDPHRPFEVLAADARIQALGTAFNVKAVSGTITVSVAEHAVRVSVDQDVSRTVQAGYQVMYGQEAGLGFVEPVNPRRATAWRRHRLVFEDHLLSTVIAELDRYHPGRIMLWDDRLKDVVVTGIFDTRDPEHALRTIQATFPVRMLRLTDHFVLLY